LLKEAIDELLGRQQANEETPIKVDVECDAYIPTEYVEDAPTRVALYRQISSAADTEDVAEIRSTLTDRFGPLPPSVESLLGLIELKVVGRALGCERMSINREGALTLYVSGNDDELRERVQRILAMGDGRFEVFYEQPLRLRCALKGVSVLERMNEALALVSKPS
jgi:transcription-repair coupling factor (superfamily II helicase)